MDKSHLSELLQRNLKGECSREELQLIAAYYNLFQNDPDIINAMTPEELAGVRETIRHTIWEKIGEQEEKAPSRRVFSIGKLSLAVAAAALIVFSVKFIFNPSGPGAPKATVVIPAMNRESHVIVLPDGTSVILDSGSKLNYPSSFDGLPKREVFLTGQAYFDVRHLAAKPFVVHAGAVNVTVLGTAFNIRALPAEADITVTVKRGKVKVSHLEKTLAVIFPRQQIIYNKNRASSVQSTIRDEDSFHWKESDLVIDNLTISEAARILEERYHVKITVTDSLYRSERFTAIFPQGEKLDEALRGICTFNGALYTYNKEGNVLIRFP